VSTTVIASLKELDMGDDGSFFDGFVRTFLDDGTSRIATLETLVASGGSFADLRRVAHTLKGSCASVGALLAAELCAQIETAGSTADAAIKVASLRMEFERCRAQLEELLRAA
jgi:HPt (histidine-containing phosphotransfer) domain-containing protein